MNPMDVMMVGLALEFLGALYFMVRSHRAFGAAVTLRELWTRASERAERAERELVAVEAVAASLRLELHPDLREAYEDAVGMYGAAKVNHEMIAAANGAWRN